MMELNGNTILITGGGSGIGLALAEEFSRMDNRVIVAGRVMMALNFLDFSSRFLPGKEKAK